MPDADTYEIRFAIKSEVPELDGFDGPVAIDVAPPGGITFIVGANNSGKSRLADAISTPTATIPLPQRSPNLAPLLCPHLSYEAEQIPVWRDGNKTVSSVSRVLLAERGSHNTRTIYAFDGEQNSMHSMSDRFLEISPRTLSRPILRHGG